MRNEDDELTLLRALESALRAYVDGVRSDDAASRERAFRAMRHTLGALEQLRGACASPARRTG